MSDVTLAPPRDPFGPAQKFEDAKPRKSRKNNPLWMIAQGIASLRLTVALLFLSILLVFFGTLAQVDGGIWHIVSDYFRSFVVWIPFDIFTVFASEKSPLPGGFPFPGGWTIGALLLTNLFAAHAMRFRLRVGILLIHSGLVVLLLSEFVTGMYAVEMNMDIYEGDSTNFAYDTREVELAVIDPSDPDQNRVVVIPQSRLVSGEKITHELLPFDITVDEFYFNSAIVRLKHGERSRATFGDGRFYRAEPKQIVPGAGASQGVDFPSAYVSLTKKGSDTPLGTCLVSAFFDVPARKHWEVIGQPKSVGGTEYQLHLRFKRYYKPYEVYLVDFTHDVYKNTTIPKDFKSHVQIFEGSSDDFREEKIWMNNPLRYSGETFFQSAFKPGNTGTVLQVVRNPGWLMPYISCAMVSLGFLVHFPQVLFRFLRRQMAATRVS
ncbi:MAG: ResB protein required for cytochrome C biosynthesis [Planctomycetota bacterium]|nr:MAG: ResB protein required for cytochrome C biosynthesis [Planctomycetota bacterium]REJ93292.1 MAG: ResB protein required for cytochrome C biosynthesis [Planctomycetota bacterium]REK30205.1 MAG: ResB protein required for cytochrome C biosynthesis [Planctomycetota bacterium]REK49257.1 MAG: ResB protein required for cytochrome C biosynthesis [Planctomycetota bacterium]